MTLNNSDEELMLAYVNGDYGAFETLYHRHTNKVFGYLSKKLKNKEMAEDVLQETFLRLHRFRAKYDSSFPFMPWLFTLCRNAMIDRLRSQASLIEESHEDFATIVDTAIAPESQTINDTPAFNIGELPHSLSANEQEVLTLRFGQDFSFDKIAKSLGIRPPAARKISQRAIEKLRRLWK